MKLHANIVNDSGIMAVLVYKALIKKSEIGKTPVWVCAISADWG